MSEKDKLFRVIRYILIIIVVLWLISILLGLCTWLYLSI
jgi:hypothetical protein